MNHLKSCNISNPHVINDTNAEVVVIVGAERLSRDCLREVIRGAFPRADVIAACSTSEIPSFSKTYQSVLAVKVMHEFEWDALLQDVEDISVRCPKFQFALITNREKVVCAQAKAAGVHAVIPVDTPLEISLAILRLVVAGETFFPEFPDRLAYAAENMEKAPQQAQDLEFGVLGQSPNSPESGNPESGDIDKNQITSSLTRRELEVLEALVCGRSNKWIAVALKLSENTVKVHVTKIMRKLGVHNRTQAALVINEAFQGSLRGRAEQSWQSAGPRLRHLRMVSVGAP